DQLHRRPEHHLVTRQLRDVDHLGARDPVVQAEDPALDVRLLLLGRVVLGVLAQVAVGAGDLDLPGDLQPLHGLELLQLFLEAPETGRGDRDTAHTGGRTLTSHAHRFKLPSASWSAITGRRPRTSRSIAPTPIRAACTVVK